MNTLSGPKSYNLSKDKKKQPFKVIILRLAISHKFKFVDDLYQNVRNVGFTKEIV